MAGEDLETPMEYRWRIKSGEYLWFSDVLSVIRDEQQRLVALVAYRSTIWQKSVCQE